MSASTAKRRPTAMSRAGWKGPSKMRCLRAGNSCGTAVPSRWAPSPSLRRCLCARSGRVHPGTGQCGPFRLCRELRRLPSRQSRRRRRCAALGGNGFMTSFRRQHDQGPLQLHRQLHARGRARQPERRPVYQYHRLSALGQWRQARHRAFSKNTDVKVSSIADGKVVAEAIEARAHGQDGGDGGGAPRSSRRRSAMAWTSPAR